MRKVSACVCVFVCVYCLFIIIINLYKYISYIYKYVLFFVAEYTHTYEMKYRRQMCPLFMQK